jgi:hypothetical protein
MKYVLLLTLNIFNPLHLYAHNFEEQTATMAFQLHNAPHAELQLIANLFYFSSRRSEQTLLTQQALLTFLDYAGKQWFSFSARRRDPLHTYEKIDQNKLTILFENSQKEYKEQERIGKIYDYVVKYVSSSTNLSPACYDLVMQVRADARQAVANACIQELVQLTQRFIESQNLLERASEYYQQQQFFGKRSLLDTFASYFPPLFMKSFISFDENMLKANTGLWHAWHETQTFTNILWNILETCRRQFYHAHYQALIHMMKQRKISAPYYQIMFDSQGLITEQERSTPLPVLT